MPQSLVSRRSLVTLLAALPFSALLPRALRAASRDALVQQPHMRAALASLREARRHLDLATPDKGGHRVQAIALVNDAITETQAGMVFDATH